jgi:hypothetical protein
MNTPLQLPARLSRRGTCMKLTRLTVANPRGYRRPGRSLGAGCVRCGRVSNQLSGRFEGDGPGYMRELICAVKQPIKDETANGRLAVRARWPGAERTVGRNLPKKGLQTILKRRLRVLEHVLESSCEKNGRGTWHLNPGPSYDGLLESFRQYCFAPRNTCGIS